MKTLKKLVASLLAIAMLLSVLSACSNDPDPTEPSQGSTKPTGVVKEEKYTVTFYNNGKVYETVEVAKGAKLTLPKEPKAEKGKGLYGWTIGEDGVLSIIETIIGHADHIELLLQKWNDLSKVQLPVAAGVGKQEDHRILCFAEGVKSHKQVSLQQGNNQSHKQCTKDAQNHAPQASLEVEPYSRFVKGTDAGLLIKLVKGSQQDIYSTSFLQPSLPI